MKHKMVVKTERVKYLDLIKAFSIILVVFCHYAMLNKNEITDNVLMSMCWLAVPCFFMCTGAIYCNKDLSFDKWKKKLVNTYIVLVVWKVIYFIFL